MTTYHISYHSTRHARYEGTLEVETRGARILGWRETTPGQRFVGIVHQGECSYSEQTLFCNEPHPDEERRRYFPTASVLVLNSFRFPGAQIGDFGSLSVQYGTGRGMGYYRITHITAEQPDPMEGIGAAAWGGA